MSCTVVPATTAALVDGCRRGEADSWTALVDRFGRLVQAIALGEGLDREDAADVTQDVFLVLLERIDSIEQPDSLAWWLMTVARRLSRRRRDRARRGLPTDGVDAEADRSSAAEVAFGPAAAADLPDGWVEVAWVHEAVASLPSPCRELLELLFLDPSEPSYQQVSRRLDMPIGSIGSCRARCLARLRTRLVVVDA